MPNEMSFEDYVLDNFLNRFKKQDYSGRSLDFDEETAIDKNIMMQFLNSTQPTVTNRLLNLLTVDNLMKEISKQIDKVGTLQALRTGITIKPEGGSSELLRLFYGKPNNNINPEEIINYNKNLFFVYKELYHTSGERIDLSLGVNGIHLFPVELKNGTTQTFIDAENQLKNERTHTTAYFRHSLCSFAMDRFEISMTANISKDSQFLPFNQGDGKGGAGNDNSQLYPTAYFYDEVMTPENITNLVQHYIIQQNNGTIIFPRYHQLKCTNNIVEDVKTQIKTNKLQDFLIASSAGSGKSLMIAWTTYRLAYLCGEDDMPIFDTVMVLSNRKVINAQLDATLSKIKHQDGLIVSPESAEELASAINNKSRIIIVNLQKFIHAEKFKAVLENITKTSEMRFAILVDEGHDSTSGEYIASVKGFADIKNDQTNVSLNDDLSNIDEVISNIRSNRHEGKLENGIFLAFTATPKKDTLQQFARPTGKIVDGKEERVPFFEYSMKQAIEEGYILDVLQNYTTYNTYCRIKNINESDNILVEVENAKKAIGQAINQDDNVITEKANIFLKFFENKAKELDGNAKAMIVTGSRVEALKYLRILEALIEVNGLKYVPLVAFSGSLEENGVTKTEKMINDHILNNSKLEEYFHDHKECNILIVADKYTTGFDEPYLTTMLVDNRLKGTKCVQTISRLNRIIPGKTKNVYVLDFMNDYEDVVDAFSTYYVDIKLYSKDNEVDIYELEKYVDDLALAEYSDIKDAAEFIEINKLHNNETLYAKISLTVKVAKDRIEELVKKVGNDIHKQSEKRKEILWIIRRFVRLYDFKSQVEVINDERLLNKRVFYAYLLLCIKYKTTNIELKMILDLIEVHNVQIEKYQDYNAPEYDESKVMKTGGSSRTVPPSNDPEKKELGEIVAEINESMGLPKSATLIQDIIDFSLKNEFHNETLATSSTFKEYFTIMKNGIPQKYGIYPVIGLSAYYKELRVTNPNIDWKEDILKPALKIIWDEKDSFINF